MPAADVPERPVPPSARSRSRSFHRKNEIIVDDADVVAARQELGAQITGSDPSRLGVTRLRLRPDTDVPGVVRRLRAVLGPPGHRRLASANILLLPWVSPGGEGGPEPAAGPQAPSADQGADVTVAVFDSALVQGFETLLPGGRVSAEPPNRLTSTSGLTSTMERHGTFVASILLSAAMRPRVVVNDVFDGAGGTDDWKLAMAIDSYLGNPNDPEAKLVSLSCGAFAEKPGPPALAALVEKYPTVVWVAAAGNVDPTNDQDPALWAWPATLPTVIGVGATDAAGEKTDFTDTRSADVWARGKDATGVFGPGSLNGVRFDQYARWSGTSFATPVVAAKLSAVVADGANGAGSAFDRAMAFLRDRYFDGQDIKVR